MLRKPVHPSLLVLLFLSATVCPAESQEAPRAQNAIHIEAFGNALFFASINYERNLSGALTARIGINPFARVLPVMVNHLSPLGGDHWVEAGLGLLLLAGDEDGFATATLGYRYQRPGKAHFFRAGLTPLLGTSGVAWWSGVSLGIAF